MKLKTFISILFCVVLFAISLSETEAQQRARIIHTDTLEGFTTEDEGEIRKLIGNVELETEDFTIVCDTAWQYRDLDELRAAGNVQITTENDRIWADEVFYDLDTEFSEFQGRVILLSDQTTLFSDFLAYDFEREIAEFPEPLRMEDEEGTLIAHEGTYYNEPDSAAFFGDVQVEDTTQYIESDSMFTVRKDEYYELHGEVYLYDMENEVRLTGDYVEADSTDFRKIEGHAWMQRLSDDKQDTTFVWADRMDVWDQDTTHVFEGFDDVHIWSDNYSSLSDTASYDDHTQLFELTGSPRAWRDNMQLTGPLIQIQLEEDEVQSLYSYEDPFSTEKDSATGRFNQLTGDTLYMNFIDGTLDYIEVWENANMFYHNKDEDDNPDGATEMETPFLRITFRDGEIYRLNTLENSPGTVIPESPGIEDERLPGFVWEPELRPEKPEEDLQRRLPPIPTERPFEYPDRYIAYLEELAMLLQAQP